LGEGPAGATQRRSCRRNPPAGATQRRSCRRNPPAGATQRRSCRRNPPPATRRPPRTVHRPRRSPPAHPDTALRREWRAGGWDIVVVVNYTTAPDPHLRTFADLATTRGRARATSGYRRATRGVWIPDHIPDDFVARCASLAFARPEVVVTGWTAAR